jgi:hypothetical protein
MQILENYPNAMYLIGFGGIAGVKNLPCTIDTLLATKIDQCSKFQHHEVVKKSL